MKENKSNKNRIIFIAVVVFLVLACCISLAPDVFAFLAAAADASLYPAFTFATDAYVNILTCIRGLMYTVICVGLPLGGGFWGWLQYKKWEKAHPQS
ncbi:MAG: hypothetical protein A2418_03090 [Candidatus Brennerbacteria bacterium RIFOXYC1_FULL_41_11]|uniref:Uncharacterized protein n=1 Tax=Candidatus Brennerbacteria bacterium RIFOXYD1_FULL_41_16 TaxID=1797529 RepID=A0A1G1XKF6_9BACT|nr:MAG: hypothetical protein A2391_00695 [Candidatus Brennerbacteria bacterium RIFOXYB1_FULL_41_13]OGY39818.1 MAG: hypothetical protein A2418_03090 [Candidatus Brennerbacteria bacterium RIFOXYC1_FULL_41_11]OGY40583.1 MAG: hypothetical protein A2570_02510 [Candidatus Brennerbacteria bacterium RIFOXYD1_FULL_41_16]